MATLMRLILTGFKLIIHFNMFLDKLADNTKDKLFLSSRNVNRARSFQFAPKAPLENEFKAFSSSTRPPKVEGKLRLYSMVFCPFAHRARLVLLAKQIPHDIVNVHLKNKPDWFLEINPKGLVPTLDTGSQIVVESFDVCDYLDEQYPEPPLYPNDETKRAHDKDLLNQSKELTGAFSKTFYNFENKTFVERMEVLIPLVQKYEDELKARGGVFFGNDKPSMVDYMLWPWAQRFRVLEQIYGEKLPGENEYPCLYGWCKAMRELKVVQETLTDVERLYRYKQQYAVGPETVDYDGE